jgi:hypothetical protein
MLEKYFVPYEEAKTLKELGFNEDCMSFWYTKNGRMRWKRYFWMV